MTETFDPSFAGTFRPAPDVAAVGAQWQGFGGITAERVAALLAAFNTASAPTGSWLGSEQDLLSAALPVDADEPGGVRLSAGHGREAVVAVREGAPEITALFPSFQGTDRYWFRLDSVDLAPDRLQMRANGTVVAELGEDAPGTSLSWYVLDPVWIRSHLRRGRSYRIGLAGLCYVCSIAQHHVLEEPVTPELRRAWTESGIPELIERAAGATYTLDLGEMKMLMSGGMNADARADDVQFRGRVQGASKMEAPVADCQSWRLRVEVMEWDTRRSLFMTLIVTEHAWRGDVPPRRGQWVEGWAWMQGAVGAIVPAPGEAEAAT